MDEHRKAINRKSARKFYYNHKEKISEYYKKYYLEHKEEMNRKNKLYRLNEKLKELEKKEFELAMIDHWDNSDYDYSRKLHNEILEVKNEIQSAEIK